MYAVIDIGSNTVRLVVYMLKNDNLLPIINKKHSVGLASYIDERNQLSSTGVSKALDVLREYRDLLKYIGAKETFVFATAAIRNINNTKEVVMLIEEETSFNVHVLSGEQEALFDFNGAIKATGLRNGLMIDVGGGSTELVFFTDGTAVFSKSLPIGSLNMFNKNVSFIAPTKSELKKIKKEVESYLTELVLPPCELHTETVCVLGGTARAAQKLLEDIGAIRPGAKYPVKSLKNICTYKDENLRMLYDNILKTSPDRVHTFIPGAKIIETIASYYTAETIVTSSCGVREGYLRHILNERNEQK